MTQKRTTRLWWIAVSLAIVAFAGATVVGTAMLHKRALARWTDGAGMHVPPDWTRERTIIWRPAERINTGASGSAPERFDEYEPRLSPDGGELVFVRRRPGANADLFVSHRTAQGWTDAEPLAAINTNADELEPEFSADGSTLWFASNRLGGEGGFDLWSVQRSSDEGWSGATNAGGNINSRHDEFGPALARDGSRIYFASDRPRPGEPASASDDRAWSATMRERKHRHDHDLYVAALGADGAGAATRVAALCTPYDDGSPALSPHGDFIYFASDRPGGAGGFDLYRSRLIDGALQACERLDDTVNSPANELDPALSAEGFRIHFSSDRDAPRAADGDDATYALWTSRSTEVFRDEASLFATLASLWSALWPWLALILLTALALALLIAILRTIVQGLWLRRRLLRLSLFARCLLLSLLLHAFGAVIFAMWKVGTQVGHALEAGGDRILLAGGDGSGGGGVLVTTVEFADEVDIGPASSISALLPADAPRATAESGEDVSMPERTTNATLALSATEMPNPVLELGVPAANAMRIDAMTPLPPEASVIEMAPSTAPSVAAVEPSTPPLALPGAANESSIALERHTSAPTPELATPSAALPSLATRGASGSSAAPIPAAPAPSITKPDAPASAAPIARVASVLSADAVASGAVSTGSTASDSIRVPARESAANEMRAVAPIAATPAAPSATPSAALKLATPATPAPTMETPSTADAPRVDGVTSALDSGALTRAAAPVEASGANGASDASGLSAAGGVPTRSSRGGEVQPVISGAALPSGPSATRSPQLALAVPSAAAAPTSSGHSDDASVRAAPVPVAPSGVLRPHADAGQRPTANDGDGAVGVTPRTTAARGIGNLPTSVTTTGASASTPREEGPARGRGLGLRLPATPAEAPPPRETFAQRDPESRGALVNRGGGNAETERAVARALEWFRKAQSSDGRWSCREHEGKVDGDAAMTGLALLSMLGAGHTHVDDGPYRDSVTRGLLWLIARQTDDGDLRGRQSAGEARDSMYGQTIASVALCEAYSMTRDPSLAIPARRAVDFVIEASRHPRGRDADVSVIGWLIMTVESARRAGFDPPPDVFASARTWLDSIATPQSGGRYAYQRGGSPAVGMTAEAMFVQQILGKRRNESRMQQSADYLLTSMPRWTAEAPTHSWYYATMSLFQHQGDAWKHWNEALAPLLVEHQRSDGTFEGSWDPQDRWSQLCGRVYQTAVCTLSLEVYYRYRVNDAATPSR